MNKIINGKEIQNKLKIELQSKIEQINEDLKLIVIQVGDDPASNVYVKNKGQLCQELGIKFEHQKYNENIKEEELISEIEKLNNNPKVTGILVQLPLPKSINTTKVIETIDYKKDVDGLTSKNIGNLFAGNNSIVPCTALGVLEILKETKTNLEGKNVAILGRSKLVGLPLIALLLKHNATITICHSKTQNLKEITRKADILIVAIGKKEFITKDYIKEKSIIIDVGINREEGKLYGDCKFDELLEKSEFITPVPGGVGPLTVIMLGNNILEAYKLQNMS